MPTSDASIPAPNEDTPPPDPRVVIIGAGPAGLTAAYQLTKAGVTPTILEADDIVGGISRSPERDGYRFDIGGHRFFTKVKAVEDLWHEILPDDLLTRPRMSRIYYEGKFFAYPIKPLEALRKLGLIEAIRCGFSYIWAKVRPPKDQTNLEGHIVADYGWRLYQHFFKTYNEKVWGVSPSEMSADFGAQRIKGMSMWGAVWEPVRARVFGRRDQASQVTSLIEEFQYPRLGPGMMWERCRDIVVERGCPLHMETKVVGMRHAGGRAEAVIAKRRDGTTFELPCDHVVSSMPFPRLVQAMDPGPSERVQLAAKHLTFRDFLTVALVVPEGAGFPDNWIYVHSPKVKVGRIQNFGVWSPYLVRDGRTCLGLEYFVHEGDDMWSAPDEELVERAKREMEVMGLLRPEQVEAAYVVRMPKAYPVYDPSYKDNVAILREWLEVNAPNVHPVGRNGMHRYNNQDHSMYTAMLTVENIFGAQHDIWSVNVEKEYHEEGASDDSSPGRRGAGGSGTGREAPITPRRVPRPDDGSARTTTES
jgi:protoporphyrinogen oxidase